jgi:hypothetical protein
MKQSFKYVCGLLLAAACLFACKKSDPLPFSAADMVYIYKAYGAINNDSIIYSFAVRSDNLMQDTIKIPVRIIGMSAPKNREVTIRVVADSSTAMAGTDYKLLPCQIPAGAYTAYQQVIIYRTAGMKNKPVKILLEVVASTDFLPGVPDSKVGSGVAGGTTRYRITLNDYLTKPDNWDSWLGFFFGTYSAVKFKFVIAATGQSIIPSDLPYGMYSVYSTLCKQQLEIYEAAHGPLIDENGDVVSFD